MAFFAYPTDFPKEEVNYLLPLIKGTKPDDTNKAIQAGWVVSGYAKSQLESMGLGGTFKPMATMTANRRAAATQALEDALKLKAKDVDSKAIPWDMVLGLIEPLIMGWLKKRLGGK